MEVGSARARVVAAGACALALSCAHPTRTVVPEAELRMWIPPVVRWNPGERRELRFAVENVSNRTVALAQPDPALARVEIYSGPEDDFICGSQPRAGGVAAGQRVELAPGDRIEVVVDLEQACRDVAPGEYRFVASYRAAAPGPGTNLWAGALPARYGNVVVARPTAAARCPPCAPERPARARKAAASEGRTP